MNNESIHIYTYTVPFPDGVQEAVLPGRDDSYTIYLSESLDENGRKRALIHAFIHIVHNDFDDIRIDAVENRTCNLEKGG